MPIWSGFFDALRDALQASVDISVDACLRNAALIVRLPTMPFIAC